MYELRKTILLASPGEEQCITIEGKLVAVERFSQFITEAKPDKSEATKLTLPCGGNEIYIFRDKELMLLANTQWENKMQNWPAGDV